MIKDAVRRAQQRAWEEYFLEQQQLQQVVALVMEELGRADGKHGPMLDRGDGLLTLEAELVELKREAHRLDIGRGDRRQHLVEAIQVTAMGIKYIRDNCLPLLEGSPAEVMSRKFQGPGEKSTP